MTKKQMFQVKTSLGVKVTHYVPVYILVEAKSEEDAASVVKNLKKNPSNKAVKDITWDEDDATDLLEQTCNAIQEGLNDREFIVDEGEEDPEVSLFE